MEDFEENPLYRAFFTKFQREFDIACRMSSVIAIPTTESLDNVLIDRYLANSHILMPSKLLKMHYNPLQGGHCDDIEIDGRKLIVYLSKKKPIKKLIINILAEEIGYNANNKEFRTLLIDRPILATKIRPFLGNILLPKSTSKQTFKYHSLKPPKHLTNHDDCLKYLESISHKLTMDLEMEVKFLLSNYVILSQYLDDAAKRIRNLVDKYIAKYMEPIMMQVSGDDSGASLLCDSVGHAITVSVETYVIHLMHGKLMGSIHSQHAREDKLLLVRFGEIRESGLTICQLGARSAFANFNLSEELIAELKQLSYNQSPLALVTSLIKLVELISDGLNHSVKVRQLMGDVMSSDEKVSICSDDLIASFVYSLARAKPDSLYSISRYLETFSWSSNAKDQAAYYTATFQIVIQYIMSFSPPDDDDDDHDGLKPQVTTGNTRPLETIQHICNQKPLIMDRGFVESLDSRACSSMDPNSSLSSVSSSLKAEWDVI